MARRRNYGRVDVSWTAGLSASMPEGRISADGLECVRAWSSVPDFAESALSVAGTSRASRYVGEMPDFCETSWADTLTMAQGEGWNDAREEIQRVIAHTSALTDATVIGDDFTYRWDVSGCEADVSRYLSGEPENMMESILQKVAKRGKVARIVVPVTYSAYVPEAIASRRGAIIAALIDAMTTAHYSLEVWAVAAQHLPGASDHRLAYAVKVKGAAEPYDPGMVAYGTGHPTMLRRLTFLCEEAEGPTARSAIGPSKGVASYAARASDLPLQDQDGPSIILPVLDSRQMPWSGTDEDAARWIEATVQAIQEGGDQDDSDDD